MAIMCKSNRTELYIHNHTCALVLDQLAIPWVVVFSDLSRSRILTIQKLSFLASSGGSLGRLAITGNVSVSERER